MPTYQLCPPEVADMARELMFEFSETYQPLIDAGVTVNYLFAHAEIDDTTGEPKGDALKLHGVKALGICRKVSLKDRVKGNADVEITLDGDWWKEAAREEQRALLDHELHHIVVRIDDNGLVKDDAGRPVIVMRKHDHEFGFFKIIAARHRNASQEVMLAARMMSDAGQYYWPGILTQ